MEKKENADRMWDRILTDLERRIIDANLVGVAMHMCNLADRALMEYDYQAKRPNAERL